MRWDIILEVLSRIALSVLRIAALLVTGAGLGWMLGMSLSPVVAQFLAAVTALVVTTTTVLIGLEITPTQSTQALQGAGNVVPTASSRKQLPKIRPEPLALIMAGIILGSCLGVYARTHDWLAPDVSTEIGFWTRSGVNREFVATRLFENKYGSKAATPTPPSRTSGLFSEKQEQSMETLLESCLELEPESIKDPNTRGILQGLKDQATEIRDSRSVTSKKGVEPKTQ